MAHKLTHLFASDVLNHDVNELPRPDHWNLWGSDLTDAFAAMIDSVIACLTQCTTVPIHASLISSLTTNAGGLGIYHPRDSAIPTFVLNLRLNIQYTTEGVWISNTQPLVQLPLPIIYVNWHSV